VNVSAATLRAPKASPEAPSVANNISNTYIGNINLSKYYYIVKWGVLYYPI
jgi:hypothetical protein